MFSQVFFSLLLIQSAAARMSVQDVAQLFRSTQVVPDILPSFNPLVFLNVKYANEVVPGQTLTVKGISKKCGIDKKVRRVGLHLRFLISLATSLFSWFAPTGIINSGRPRRSESTESNTFRYSTHCSWGNVGHRTKGCRWIPCFDEFHSRLN